jgi:hypothetical protein
LETKLGCKISHRHYDRNIEKWVGDEHRLDEWRNKPVDGYFIDRLSNQRVVVEFLGDDVHGHPTIWKNNKDAKDRYGDTCLKNYTDTHRKMLKVKSFGYRIIYAWYTDIYEAHGKPKELFMFREFEENLEWE